MLKLASQRKQRAKLVRGWTTVRNSPQRGQMRAIEIIEVAGFEIIARMASACRSSRTVASSLSVVRPWCRLVVPDPGDGVAGHLAEVDGAVVHRERRESRPKIELVA